MRKLYLLLIFVFCSFTAFAQTKGLIYKPASTPASRLILDPNKDGYTSIDSTGFKTNDRGNGESEIKYKNIPILENEPIQDPLRGPACGFTDMVDSGTGDPVMFYFDGTNFLVRFRLNKTSPNSKGYSVLIDTDQKFGFSGANKDDNAKAGNPGFELELVLETNHGVSLYNIDNLNTKPATSIVTLDYDVYSQKSIAFTDQCDDMDYFYDFYIPWSYFGLSADTKLRMVALTVMNPHPATGNNAKSDVGGVDDRKYGGNYDWLYQDFIDNFMPTAPNEIGTTGLLSRTKCPTITSPINANPSSISGTVSEAIGTKVKVYKNGTTYLGEATTTTSSGAWTLSGLSGIEAGAVITAIATAPGKGDSYSTCNSVKVAATCTAILDITKISMNGKGVCGEIGAGIPGAQVFLYDQNMVQVGISYTVLADGSFQWKCNASASNCNSGTNCLNNGVYIMKQQLGTDCMSEPVFLCYNVTTLTDAPAITAPILFSSTSVSGTVPSTSSGATIYLFAAGKLIGQTIAAATSPYGWTVTGLTLTSGQVITARAAQSGKCASNVSSSQTVQGGATAVPIITGSYCATSLGTALMITGTSTEANETVIEVFRGITSLGTTKVYNGTWSKDATVFAADNLTAKATALGKTASSASVMKVVNTAATGSSVTVTGPINEGATSVSGTTSVAGTIKLYIDEIFVKDTTVTGSSWTINKLKSYDIYAGGKVTATVTPSGGCESGYSAAVQVNCIPPTTSLSIDPLAASICSGKTSSFRINDTQELVFYELFTKDALGNATKYGSSKIGTGTGTLLTFSTGALTANTIFYVKATKLAPIVCAAELANKHTVTVTSVISSNTVTAPNNQNQYCGATAIGDLVGSDPAGGNGTFSYQWQSSADGNTWTNVGGNTKNYNPGTVSSTTHFRRIVTSGSCLDANPSAAVVITISPALTNTLTYAGATDFCVSGSPTQINGSTNASFLSYQWQSSTDGVTYTNLPGVTAQTANYTAGTLTQTTYFRRWVKTSTCDSYSNVITFRVFPAISNNNLLPPVEAVLCQSGTVGKIEGSLPTGDNSTYTYRWQKSTNNGSDYTDITPIVSTRDYTPGAITSTTYFRRVVESTTCSPSYSDPVKITVASAAVTLVTAATTQMLADGLSTTTITVQLKDIFSTHLSTDVCAVTLSTDKGTLTAPTFAGNGSYTATLTSSTTAEKATITGSIAGTPLTSKAEVLFISGPSNLAKSTVVATPLSVLADGTAFSSITVQLKDGNGNNTTSTETLTITSSLGTVFDQVDLGSGQYTAKLKSTVTGSAAITATLGSSTLASKPAVSFTAGTADLVKSTVVASPLNVLADGTAFSSITVQLKDGNGNNTTSTEALTISSSLGTIFDQADLGNGQYIAKLRSTTTGSATITASLGSSSLSSKPMVSFTAGNVDLAKSTVVASPLTVLANGTAFSTITVQLKDANGNNTTSNQALTITSSLGTVFDQMDLGNGQYTAKLKSIVTGSSTVTATLGSSALTSKPTVNFTSSTADLAKSTVVATPLSVLADGTAFSTITVQLKDGNGNNTTSTEALTITSSLGTITELTDLGNGQYTAKLKSTATGSATVTATLGSSALSNKPVVSFTAGAADLAKSTVVASPLTVLADGTAFSTITVQLKDANGNNTSSTKALTISASLGTIFDQVDLGNGQYTAKLQSTVTGSATITATLGGSALTSKPTVNFTAGSPDLAKSTVVASPLSVQADGTAFSTITVQLKDGNGNNTSSTKALTITSSLGAITELTDLGNGQYTAKIKSTTTGSATITATLGSSALTSKPTVNFTAGSADLAKSTVVASPLTVLADGIAFSTITVQLKDGNGNNTTSTELLAINSSLGTIFDQVDLGNGQYTAKLKSTTTGSATITASLGTSALSSKPVVSFTAGAADLAKSTVVATPLTVLADGTAFSTITVQLKDANGNNTTSTEALTITSSLGTITELTDLGNGQYTAKLKSTTTGSATITATLGGSALTSKPVVSFTAGAADLAKSTVVAAPLSVLADGMAFSTITVQLKDVNGNNTTSSQALTITSSLGIVFDQVDLGNGQYTAKLKSTATGSATVTATLGSSVLTSKPAVSFTPGAADLAKSTVVASPLTVLADGTAFSTVTVQLKDANSNNTTSTELLVISSSLGTVFDQVDLGNGQYTAKLKSSTTGSATITATLGSSALSSKPVVSFTAGNVDLTKSTVVATPLSVLADGTAFSTVTVQLKDANGNNTASSQTLDITSSLGAITEVTELGNGLYTAKLRSTATGSATITATLGGSALNSKPVVNFTSSTADLAKSTVVASPLTVLADGIAFSTITIQLKDGNGNNTTSTEVLAITSSLGTIFDQVDLGNGQYTAKLKSTATGSATVTATLGSSVLTSKPTVNFISGAADLAKSTVVATPLSVLADGTAYSTITVQLKDGNGNNTTSSQVLTITSSLGTVFDQMDLGNGQYTAKLKSIVTGSSTVTATLGSSALTSKPTVNFTSSTADLAKSTVVATPLTVLADGTAFSTITVQLKDANGNNTTSSQILAISSSLGSISELTDLGNGQYTAKLRSIVTSSATITATLGSSTLASKPVVNFTAGAADLAKSTVVASPLTILADGTAFSTITVQLKDANGNNTTSTEALAITSSLGTVFDQADLGNGQYTAKLKSTTTGSATITATLGSSALTSKPTVNFTAGIADLAKSTVVVSPLSVLADGTAFSTITVQLKDGIGNNTTSTEALIITSTLGTIFDQVDLGGGQYTAKLRSTVTGSATITATLGSSALTSKPTVNFTPGNVDLAKSTVVASPLTVLADGTAFSTVTVQLKEGNGNNTTSTQALTITSSLGTVFDQVDLGNGQYSAKLRSTVTGSATITATLGSSALSSKPVVNFAPGAADLAKSTVVASPNVIDADGTAFSTITVQLKDANSNNTTSGAVLTLSRTLGTIYQLTNNGGGNYTARIKSTATGTSSITAKLGSSELSTKPVVYFIAGSVNLTTSTVTVSPSTVKADGTSYSTITVQLKDAAGNNTASSADLTITSSLGTVYEFVNNGNDNFTARLKSSEVGSAVITLKVDTDELSTKPTVNFVAGTAHSGNSLVTVSPSEVTADGIQYATITVQLKDANGHLATSTSPLSILSSLGTVSEFLNLGNGKYTAKLKSPVSGTATITTRLGSMDLSQQPSVLFTPGAADLLKSTVVASPESVKADGIAYTTITVQLKDAQGNPATSNSPLTITSNLGSVYDWMNEGNGHYTAKVKSTEAGTSTVVAKLGDQELSVKPKVIFTPGTPDLSQSVVTVGPASVIADGEEYATVTIQLKDAQGNPTETTTPLHVDGNLGTVTDLVNHGGGKYTARIKSTVTGVATITARLDGDELSTQPEVNFLPGPVHLQASTVEVSRNQVLADGEEYTLITVQLKDAHGNVTTTSETITIGSDLGTVYQVEDQGAGRYTARLKSTTTGKATISVQLAGNQLASQPKVQFTPGPPSLTASTVTVSQVSVGADGLTYSVITVQLKDAQGNPTTSAEPFVIESNLGTVYDLQDNGDGTYTARIKSTITGTALITAKLATESLTTSPRVEFTPGVADLAQSTVEVSPSIVTADGTSFSIITVQLKDANGNNTTSGSPLNLASSLGSVYELTDLGEGKYTAKVKSAVIGSATVTAKLGNQSLNTQPVISFVSGEVSLTVSTLTAQPASVVADGVSQPKVTIQLKDAAGNIPSADAGKLAIMVDGVLVTNVVDKGDGVFEIELPARTSPASVEITASYDGQPLADQATVTYTKRMASTLTSTISASETSIAADGISTSIITVVLMDAQGNRLTAGGDQVTLNTTLGALSSVTDNQDGSYTATLTSTTSAGLATITGQLDGQTMNSQSQVEFTQVLVVNKAPVAGADAFATTRGTALQGNVLTNDSDPDGDVLRVKTTPVQAPLFGTLLLRTDGTFTYTPNADFVGEDSFRYQVCDNATPSRCSEATVTIQVKQPTVFIPEGFSPDGDGDNDAFIIQGAENMKVSLVIYNRWGNVVYESQEYKNDWTGIANQGFILGDKLPDGTYFYVVDFHNGEKPVSRYLTIKRK